MKFKILLCAFFWVTLQINGQKISLNKLKELKVQWLKEKISLATKYQDSDSRIQSMLSIISMEGENSSYKDTLAAEYFFKKKYLSAHLLSKELLEKNTFDERALEINANSLLALNATKEAVLTFEKLFSITNKMSQGYQLAFLQYNLKRFDEAKLTISKTLLCQPIENAYIDFVLNKDANQKVPLIAAAHNLKGLIFFELKEHLDAANSFKEALKIMPEFSLAKQNINAISLSSN